MKNKFAFTLAEVLITLTIIGVIAALTIPNLMQNYQEHSTVNKVKKFYSTLTNAYAQAVKENGTISEWGIVAFDADSSEKMYELIFKPYFKIIKHGHDYRGFTTAGKYKKVNGSDWESYTTTTWYRIKFNDGMVAWTRPGFNGDHLIFLDINGEKAPNVTGKDLFAFRVGTKIYPIELSTTAMNSNFGCYTTGIYCTAWVVYKGNMDYLHCSDLSWNGKDKCKQ